MPKIDVLILGAGHNGLVASILLAREGLAVTVLEERPIVGGACVTEYPFKSAPKLGCSTGAYLLGLMPPELIEKLNLDLPLIRRDPHYFLPTTSQRYLLFGSDAAELRQQFIDFFSESDWLANQAMNAELGQIRDDLAPAWLMPPLTLEETAERFIRKPLRQKFLNLCRGSARDFLERFGFRSDLLNAMYAVTDAFSGLHGGYNTPGTGMNLLVHNMCRLPGSDGTWMVVRGGMGTVTQRLARRAIEEGVRIRTGEKVISIETRGAAFESAALQSGESISARALVCNADPFRVATLLRPEAVPADLRSVLDDLGRAYDEMSRGLLPEFPAIEWYIHTAADPSLQDSEGRHSSALFVQWVPYAPKDTSWEREEDRYVRHLLSICDRFAPGSSELVREAFVLTPPKIERYFGISRGHIHHVDNKIGFTDRVPYRSSIDGLYFCGAGCHPAGSVIGASGHNAAQVVRDDLR